MKNRFQKKIFLAFVGLFALVGGSVFCIVMYLGKMNIYGSMEKQYRYVNENAYTRFANQYNEIDSMTDGWILSGTVQNSLLNEPLDTQAEADVEASMSVFQGKSIDYYLYVDNKFNIFYMWKQHRNKY